MSPDVKESYHSGMFETCRRVHLQHFEFLTHFFLHGDLLHPLLPQPAVFQHAGVKHDQKNHFGAVATTNPQIHPSPLAEALHPPVAQKLQIVPSHHASAIGPRAHESLRSRSSTW